VGADLEPIPEFIVERTWREFAGFTPDKAKKEMTKINRKQPELLALVVESSKEMGREVSELAIYLFVVVYRMFQEVHPKVRRISSEEVIECYKQNESLMERLNGAHERFLDRIAGVQTSTQPHVVNYIIDALMEEDEGKDATQLTEEQKGFLYLLLKTVVDVLDRKGVG
jgi:hypothetical protein